MNQFNDANWTGRVPRTMYQSRWGAHARLVAPEAASGSRGERRWTVVGLCALILLAVCVVCLVL